MVSALNCKSSSLWFKIKQSLFLGKTLGEQLVPLLKDVIAGGLPSNRLGVGGEEKYSTFYHLISTS